MGSSGATAQILISFDFHYTGGVTNVQIGTNGVDVNADGEQEQLRNLYGSLGGKNLTPGAFTLPSSSTSLQLFTANGYPGVQGLAASTGINTNAAATLMGKNVDLVGFAFGVSPNTPYNVSSLNNFYLGKVTYTANNLSQAIITSPPPGPAPVSAGDVANPEPATMATLGSGLLGLVGFAYRRRKRN
jgi:hypothetical protein